ncbi:MAG TPA: hypothetical protein VF377_04920 [Acidimicrobiia bacterium]|jgi:hypothetical protein
MRALHETWAWVAIVATGLVGLWGLVLARRGEEPGRPFWVALGVATVIMLAQVGMGVYLIAAEGRQPGDQHVFYGFLIAFTFAFAYIYRSQMRRRPALYYGLLLLFVMGLGIRCVYTWGVDF